MTVKCKICGNEVEGVTITCRYMVGKAEHMGTVSQNGKSIPFRCPKCNGEWGNV